jgi:hypothetical protein
MKIVKLDGRFAGYPKWQYALQFPLRGSHKLDLYKFSKIISSIYGAEQIHNPEYSKGSAWDTPYWIYNDSWRLDRKRGRILFKNQADITMTMLKAEVDQ